MILAVDTSLGSVVALIDAEGATRALHTSDDPLAHAEVIGDLLVAALRDAGDPPVDAVVAGMGPGPFTGLRIGIAAARTFALARDVSVIPVPSHWAAAWSEIVHNDARGPFAVVTDARRREVAITVFDGCDSDGLPRVVADTVLVRRDASAEHLSDVRSLEVTALDGAALARVGARAAAAGRVLTGAEPIYLRHPDVTLPGAPKRVGL